MMAKNLFFLLAIFFLTGTAATSQNTKEFTGEVETGDGKKAIVRFGYTERAGERILNGRYLLESERIDSLRKLFIEKETWSGNFISNLRNGEWSFQKKTHELRIRGVKDYRLDYDLLSREENLKGSYEKGIQQGVWKFNVAFLKNGQFVENLASSEVRFRDGRAISVFHTSGEDSVICTIEGYADAAGFLDSTWRFSYEFGGRQLEEVREYRNGFILSLTKADRETGDTLIALQYEDVKSKLELLDEVHDAPGVQKSSRHFPITFDHGYPGDFLAVKEQLYANRLLENVLAKIAARDTALSNASNFGFSSARFVYELGEQETAKISQITHHYDSLSTFMQIFEQNRVLKMNEQLSDSLAWISSYIKVYKDRLSLFGPDIQLMTSSSFRYANPIIFAERFRRHLPPTDTVSYAYRGETSSIVIHYEVPYTATLFNLEERLRSELSFIQELHLYADRKLGEVKRSEQLAQMENMILGRKERADSVFSAATYYNPQTKRVAEAVYTSFLVNRYSLLLLEYANESGFNEKLSAGYTILNLLDVCSGLPDKLNQIYRKRDEIEEVYTVVKLDPYTFNYNFKTRKKRRLYEKGAEELFGYFISSLINENDFMSLKDRISAIEKLHDRLLELLDEETTKLEKRLRNEDNPEKIRELLSI